MIKSANVVSFFEEILSDLDCHADTRAYIVGVFDKYKTAQHDLSKYSITLLFAQARANNDFSIYQNIGDWLFYLGSYAPGRLSSASKEYYDTIARLSYYACYKRINSWHAYGELAERFIPLEEQVKSTLISKAIIIV